MGYGMRTRLSLSTGLILLVAAYMASPYVALWRLQAALDRGDTQALEKSIDWTSIRAGLKEDIAEGVIGPTQQQAAADTLPPFGTSFITGIADTTVEREVTPQNLIAVMRQMHAPPSATDDATSNPFASFAWAFFESPTVFNITVRNADDDTDTAHLRLRMVLRHGQWTLIRAWVPQDIVERAGQRT